MDNGLERTIEAAVNAAIANRDAGDVLYDLYHASRENGDDALADLIGLLPTDQIASIRLVERLRLSDLGSVVILLGTLRALRTNEGWIHYALARYLNTLIAAGVTEAKFPAITHALLALEGLRDNKADSKTLPLSILARELASFAPREAIRAGMLAIRHGNPSGLDTAEPAFTALGIEGFAVRPGMAETLRVARELGLGADTTPSTTSVDNATDSSATVVEAERHIILPLPRGETGHYIFAQAGREARLPKITVHAMKQGAFSIDATSPGLEQRYVFDRAGDCILDLANGIDPFIADTVVECDEPVAILDDRFSGVMNICHFLMDRLTRVSLYERSWTTPGKFFIVDDFQYYHEILSRTGLTDRVIFSKTKRVTVRAPELWFSSNIAADFRHPAHLCAGWAIDYLRRILDVPEIPARLGRKLMISRADARGRGVVNWDEARAIGERHGFEVVELSALPVEAQIALFRDVSQVVGVHGAGLTNVLFAPRDCVVLEILPPMVATQAYWLLASRLGQRYTAMIADDPEMPRPDYATWQHDAVYNGRSIVIPPERLEAALAAL